MNIPRTRSRGRWDAINSSLARTIYAIAALCCLLPTTINPPVKHAKMTANAVEIAAEYAMT